MKYQIEKIESIREELKKQILLHNSKRRERILNLDSVDKFLDLIAKNSDLSIQIRAGAVASSYKYPAKSTYLRYNYKTQNIIVGTKKFTCAFGDGGDISIKKYDYGF